MLLIVVFAIMWVLTAHWFADFVLQSHWMASNKSKSNTALLCHTSLYSIVLTLLLAPLFISFETLLLFFLITFVAHTITDYVTSRITSTLYAAGSYHNFFVVIGFDQLLHYGQIFTSLALLVDLG